MATDDDDAATLRERVRDLEATVAQQQDTIEQLMPSRRAILAGGAGLVGGAALTGQASAQSAAGQVGTSSEPVDVEAATVSADSVNTEKGTLTDGTNDESTEILGTLSDTDDTTVVDESLSFDATEKVVIEGLFSAPSDLGSFSLQINGNSSPVYRYEQDGTNTQDDTKAPIGTSDFNRGNAFRVYILTGDIPSSRPGFECWAGDQSQSVTGYLDQTQNTISSVRIFEDSGSNSILTDTIVKGTDRVIP